MAADRVFNINIYIDNDVHKLINHDFKKSIIELLLVIPENDLLGLREIRILVESKDKKYPRARGFYNGFSDPNNRSISLFIKYTFPKKKRPLLEHFHFIKTAAIGYVLFHELGHHYHNMHHGVKKEERESFADIYRKKYYHKWLNRSKIYRITRILLLPFQPIIKWLLKNNHSNHRCTQHRGNRGRS